MGLNGLDDGTGVRFKKRNPKPKTVKAKDLDNEDSSLVIEKVKKEPKLKSKSLLDDLKDMADKENNSAYKALIDDQLYDYDFALDTEVNDTPHNAICLGRGYAVLSNFNTDIVNGDVVPPEALNLYFWKKVSDVDNEVIVDGLDGDEINTFPADMITGRNPELNMSGVEAVVITTINNDAVVDQDDLTNEVKQKEEDLTMTTNNNFTKANELLATLKESGDKGVDILIDYCKISFAEVFTKTNNGADAAVVTDDLQNQMVYIITEINKNDLLTPESKAKLTEAIENESIEYQKLLESMTDITIETKELLEKKESDDMSWGTITLIAIGAVLAVGAAYSLYRYFEPENVVIDMSTMSIMDR